MEIRKGGRNRSGANLEGASEHNRRVVLDRLRLRGPMSRADLARESSLTVQTVSNIVESLAAVGLVAAGPRSVIKRGKPAELYNIAPTGGYAIGIHIDHYETRGVLVDLCGSVLRQTTERLSENDLDAREAIIVDNVKKLHAAIPRGGTGKLLGIGVAAPGPFGPGADAITSPGASWIAHVEDICRSIEAATGHAVQLENDAAMAAVGERMQGAARGLDNFALVFIGRGFGCAFFANGEACRGAMGNAGELGMLPIEMFGPAIPGIATLEWLFSLEGLCRRLDLDPADEKIHEKLISAPQGAGTALSGWISDAAVRLRHLVALIEASFDPETVVVGGHLPQVILDEIMRETEPLVPTLSRHADRRLPRIIGGSTGQWSVAMGAALEPIERIFAPSFDALLKKFG